MSERPGPVVVVGASLAGLHAVEGVRRAGFKGELVLVGAEEHLPYNRPPLSKSFLTGAVRHDALGLRTEEHLANLGVTLRLGTTATGLDLDAREVVFDGARLPFGSLLITTGSRPATLPPVGGNPPQGVHLLRTVDDATALREDLLRARDVVVIGAGFIGAEVASSAAALGARVTVVEAAPTPLARALGPTIGEVCGRLHGHHGVTLRCGSGVAQLEGAPAVKSVLLTDGTRLPADVVVVGIGVRPDTGWLEGSGLDLSDGVVCDETLNAGAPGVWAAGDVVTWTNPLYGRRMRLQAWTAATEQARAAAANAVADTPKPCPVIPYFWSDQYGKRLAALGVPGEVDKPHVVGDLDGLRFVSLHPDGDRIGMVFALDRPDLIMKFRKLVMTRAPFDEAVGLAERLVA
jgi:NADPH-dependent 2,4-dienoyl-CoA reductase/sulfur reductase-like enzyme